MVSSSAPVVLVGNDGSEPSREALVWALGYARRNGARLRVMRGWSMRTAPRPATMTRGYVPPLADFEAAVIERLRDDVAPMLAEHGAGVEVELRAHHGAAANGLIEASVDADLMVVGARGLGGFRGLALGSVTDQCVRHAACPVVVIRDDETSATERKRKIDQAFDEPE